MKQQETFDVSYFWLVNSVAMATWKQLLTENKMLKREKVKTNYKNIITASLTSNVRSSFKKKVIVALYFNGKEIHRP